MIELLVASVPAPAQRVGTLAEWKQRVFDPASIGLEVFPGSQRNLKFTIDQIRLDESKVKMVVYIIDFDDMEAAAHHYAKQLGTSVEETGVGTLGELRVVEATPNDPKFAGLRIRVERAQWATGKGQVWMKYAPPESGPSS